METDFASEIAPFAALMAGGHAREGKEEDEEEAGRSSCRMSRIPAGVAEEAAAGGDVSAVVAVAPFTPKWARKYKPQGLAGSAGSDAGSLQGDKAAAAAKGCRTTGTGGAGGKRPTPVGVSSGCDDSQEGAGASPAGDGGTPTLNLNLKLEGNSPNLKLSESPSKGNAMPLYLGANDIQPAPQVGGACEESDLSDALGLQPDADTHAHDSSDDIDSSVTSEVRYSGVVRFLDGAHRSLTRPPKQTRER